MTHHDVIWVFIHLGEFFSALVLLIILYGIFHRR